MTRFVTVSTNVVASHAFGGGSGRRIGTSSIEVVAPANVAFALQTKIELLQLLWTVLLSPSGFPPLVWIARFGSRSMLGPWRGLWRCRRSRCRCWKGQDKHRDARLSGELLESIVQGWNIIVRPQSLELLLCQYRPQLLIRTQNLLQFHGCKS